MEDFLASRRGRWVVLAVVLALVVVTALVPRIIASERLLQSDRPVTRTDFLMAGPGNVVEVAFEVNAAPSEDVLAGNLLEEQSPGTYRRTSQAIRVQFAPSTPIIMGSLADVRPGALLQVSGAMADAGGNLVIANRIVVLSGYVAVQ